MKDEALRLALEALRHFEKAGLATLKTIDAIIAIKQALEQEKALQALHDENERLGLYKDAYGQPEPEPVAFINVEQRKLEWAKYTTWDTPTVVNLPKIPLYTSPPKREWQGLTDEDLVYCESEEDVRFVRAIEAKLKQKNGYAEEKNT